DADARMLQSSLCGLLDESERHTVDEIHQPEAVGPFYDQIVRSRNPNELPLVGEAPLSPFRKSSREYNDGSHLSAGELLDRFEHANPRDGEHGDINSQWQLFRRGQTGSAGNLLPLWVNQMDRAV